jgi:DNA invertase Pin-like site-specific DNA recombinase
MRQNRYQSPKRVDPDSEQLPLETICTILVRQSTVAQATAHVHSAEVNPNDLIAEAQRHGFPREHIRLVHDDMGIGAYSTRIEDRPGLSRWLFEDLPSGKSLVVLVSHEDRLFRDRDETEHNRFIALVAKYGGWAICGQTVYNFHRKFDQERFRYACKAGKDFIEGHIKARLHPAIQRAAMQGKYTGGSVPWGYVVDYNTQSPTYKHLMVYPPHVPLVVDDIFHYFANLPRPSLLEVGRHWQREGLVFPFYGPDVDPHVVRTGNVRTRDEARGGYRITWQRLRQVLTDVTYLGWRVRAGQIAWDTAAQAPLVCHPALIDADLFWWCYDKLLAERPEWAPPRTTPMRPVRARRSYGASPDEVRMLGHGQVFCVVHRRALSVTVAHGKAVYSALCPGASDSLHTAKGECAAVAASEVDTALVTAFTAQLDLDSDDEEALARMAERRLRDRIGQDGQEARLHCEISEQRALVKRAMQQGLRVENASLAEQFFAEARQAQHAAEVAETKLTELRSQLAASGQAWSLATQASSLAERIRATFGDWSRQAQARVLALALDEAVVGHVDRVRLGLWARWVGGGESRQEIRRAHATPVPWSDVEIAAFTRYYPLLTWRALEEMFPGRTRNVLNKFAITRGLTRPRIESFSDVTPCVVSTPGVRNTMGEYGFPLPASWAIPEVHTVAINRRCS